MNRGVPVLAARSAFALKPTSGARGEAKAQFTGVGRGPMPDWRRPRKAAISLQCHRGPAEWEGNNPCYRQRGIFAGRTIRPDYRAATPGCGPGGTRSQTGRIPVAALAESNRPRSVVALAP